MGRKPQPEEFLVGSALADRIKTVANGPQPRCSVAFWSASGIQAVFPEGIPTDAKVICDISMGSTSAEALEELGAPDNENLRHAFRMHTKVFLSGVGLVTGSANASASALGSRHSQPNNVEAGTFHPHGSAPWEAASKWFDELYRDLDAVGIDEIEWARLIYRPRPRAGLPSMVKSGSLLDLVVAAPWHFAKVGFAITSEAPSKETKAQVRKQMKESRTHDPERIDELHDGGTFSGWTKSEVRGWPEYFFSFWQPNERLNVYGCRVEGRVLTTGSLMTSNDLRGLRAACNVALPSVAQINHSDAKMALRILDGASGVFYPNGQALADRIVEIQAKGE